MIFKVHTVSDGINGEAAAERSGSERRVAVLKLCAFEQVEGESFLREMTVGDLGIVPFPMKTDTQKPFQFIIPGDGEVGHEEPTEFVLNGDIFAEKTKIINIKAKVEWWKVWKDSTNKHTGAIRVIGKANGRKGLFHSMEPMDRRFGKAIKSLF